MSEKPASLPGGTVTLLFTDIEGSTKLVRSLGKRYVKVLGDHRDLLRAAFAKWNGAEVDTQGDSFFVAFPKALDAISAASEGQLALDRHEWPEGSQLKVRMGLHTGEPEIGPTGYVGVDVHRAARISAAAHGGQILLSASTGELIGDGLPEGLRLVDLGHYRLKDLKHSEHLYELEIAQLPADFPPPRGSGAEISNLPAQLTSFVGREQELEKIDQLLGDPDCRILTLVGPGGIGKTRLAVESAARQAHSFADGACFVALAPLKSEEHLLPTVAGALHFDFDTHSSDLDPKSQLLDYLGDRSVLMLMDNFEHLIKGADLLVEMAEGAPGSKILVTSRERLNLQSEWTFDVEGMQYPTNGDGFPFDDYSALRLFQERARQVRPDFTVAEEESSFVSRICQLTEGMPLGIELATAWVSTLSCREIAEEMQKSIDFLASRRKDLPARHRSLRAAFEHSWNLLPEEQREVFRKLSVFRGGFSRQAAEKVSGAGIRVLSNLVHKSLLHRDARGRYEMHELLRQYAQEKLAAAPGEESEIRDRHSTYYVEYLEEREPALGGEGLLEARGEIQRELGNVRTALHWCLLHWDQESAREALFAYRSFYWTHGWHEGYQEMNRIVAAIEGGRLRDSTADGGPDPVHLAAKVILSGFMTDLGLHEESESICQSVLPDLKALGLAKEQAGAMTSLTINAALRGESRESIERGSQAIDLAEKAEWSLLVGLLHLWIGWDHYQLGTYDEAQSHFDESYRIFSEHKNEWALAFALSKLGLVADASKDYSRAIDYHNEARDIFLKLGDKAGEAYTLSRLSMSLYGLGEIEAAIRAGHQGLHLFEEIGHRWGIGASLCRIGFPVLQSGDTVEARDLFVQALERALEFKMEALALYALGGLASVLTVEGHNAESLEIFAIFLEHPVTPVLYKETAQPYIDQARAGVPTAKLEPSKLSAEGFQLDVFAREVLARNMPAPVS